MAIARCTLSLDPYATTPHKGILLKRSDGIFTNMLSCTDAAREWLDTADYDMAFLEQGPILIIETVEEDNTSF